MEFSIRPKVVVCGDSISAGIIYDENENKYVKSKDGFVRIMQNSLNCAVTNISKFGNTIFTAIPRLKSNIDKEKPDIVLIELGGNDCDYKWNQIADDPQGDHHPATEAAAFEQNLGELVCSLKSTGVAPVLMTLPPIDADRYFKWISRSSAEAGTQILQWLGSVTRIYWWQEKYNSIVLNVAKKNQTTPIDLRSAFLSTPDFREYLCMDGIHPNIEGQKLICRTISEFIESHLPSLLQPALA